MYTETCPAGHEIRSSSDRTSQGFCRACKRDADRLDRQKVKAALTVVKAFEAVGVRFQTDGAPADPADVARQLVALYGDTAPTG
jgi:hypothetical protein